MTNHALYILVAVSAGGLLATKSGLNARLSVLTRDTLLATTAGLFAGLVCVGGLLVASTRELPQSASLTRIPLYLWTVGGALTAAASLSVYWLIPRLGITSVVAIGLAGQLVTSLVAGQLGWFGLPPAELTPSKQLGAVAVLAGALAVSLPRTREPAVGPHEPSPPSREVS